MTGESFSDSIEDGMPRTPPRVVLLSLLMAIILAGALGPLSLIHRSATWAVWACILACLWWSARELPIWQLLNPVLPYLAWLCFFLTWGLIVSPIAAFALAGKVVVTTTVLAACMATLTAKPNHLRTLANFSQLAVLANLLLWALIPWSSNVSALLMRIANQTDADLVGFTRYGGLFGNANMLGYICLVATILSVLAVPWIAWVGRSSCLLLIYLSASRKSAVLYLLVIALYLVIVQRRNVKLWVGMATVGFLLAMTLVLSDGLRAKSRLASEDQTITRLLDLQEKAASQRGETTRVDLLHQWMSVIRDEPWYGYGFQAMRGTIYDEEHPGRVLIKGPLLLGTHNTYLGVWIENGPIGFIAFILMLLHYLKKCLFNGEDPVTKWVLVSFMVVNLAILFVSHNHLFSFEGMAAFSLCFLLPSSAGLPWLGRSLTWE